MVNIHKHKGTDSQRISHNDLLNRDDDGHSQYHNDTRGDARYLYKENTDSFTPDGDYEPATKKYVDDKKIGDVITCVAGQTIGGDTRPYAVFLSTSDNKVYLAEADQSENETDIIGFAVSAANADDDVSVQTQGVVSGFSGLTQSSKYYVADQADDWWLNSPYTNIKTSPGAHEVLVGIAISSTQILIKY
jgi:hypothetical protein